jgi:mannose-6-phosphate isomerase
MSDNLLYPYIIKPKVVAAIWGGDALVQKYGKSGPADAALGESWECWDENIVTNGLLAGKSIADLRQEMGKALLGNLDAAEIFPILTKIIDARQALSVQVHPDDTYARRVENQLNGKTECWLVLAAQPDAEIVLGWNAQVSRPEYERRVADGSLGAVLRRVPVKAGDAFFLPAGTLHAIGAGIIIFETQQASNLTYRIFDWNRVDAQGNPRELHISKAADVVDYRCCTAGAIEPLDYTVAGVQHTAVIADPRFVVERVQLTHAPHLLPTEGRPLIFMALEQPIELHCKGGSAHLGPFETALVPAGAAEVTLRTGGHDAQVMVITPPLRGEAIAEKLAAAGIAPERIQGFLAQFAQAPERETEPVRP